MVNPVQIQFADGLSRTEYTYFMQATMYTSIFTRVVKLNIVAIKLFPRFTFLFYISV